MTKLVIAWEVCFSKYFDYDLFFDLLWTISFDYGGHDFWALI